MRGTALAICAGMNDTQLRRKLIAQLDAAAETARAMGDQDALHAIEETMRMLALSGLAQA